MTTERGVNIPVSWLAGEPPLPDRCARHGQPVLRRVTFAIRSNPKMPSRAKMLLPGYTVANRAEEYLQQVRVVKAAAWPLCRSCARARTVGLTLAGVFGFGGLAAMIAAFVVGGIVAGPQPWLLAPILGGLAAMLCSPFWLGRASLTRLTGTAVTNDGAAVHIDHAHPDFIAQLPQDAVS
jgi:hypothetical protein